MQAEFIQTLINQGEGIRVEFKEAGESVPDSFFESVVSFSNTDGGTILLGILDDGTISGISEELLTGIQKDIISAVNSRDCINPPLYLQPMLVYLNEKSILVVQVQSSSQVHDHAGRIYIREHECDLDITNNQVKVSDLYLRKRNFFTEGHIYPHLSVADLDHKMFEKARNLIRNYRSDHPWLLADNDQMLRDSVLWKKDFSTGQEGLTLAAALIFGKDITIQSILPAYKVEAMVRISNKDRWDDRITLRTNLIDTYLGLKQFINKHLSEKFFMEGDQRIDLRDKIFREVVGNVIVHREYTSPLSTELIISENSVTLTNPNKPLFHGPIDPASFNPFPKNPNIRKFFTAFGWTDEIGSGIRNTYRYLPLYIPGAKPLFIENDTFRTKIPLLFNSLNDFVKPLLDWFEIPEDATDHIELQNVALQSDLSNIKWEEALLHLVPTWHIIGTQYPQLKWPVKQSFTKSIQKLVMNLPKKVPTSGKKVSSSIQKGAKLPQFTPIDIQLLMRDEIKKVPSWNEKGAKLLSKKVFNLIKVLLLTTKPATIEQLMLWMDYKKRQSFREIYLLPLQNCGMLSKTNPEKPNDPSQQYVITVKGRDFLGGG